MTPTIPKQGRSTEQLLPLVAVGLSLFSLYTALFWPLHIPEVIISVIGLLAGITYFLRKQRWFFLLMQVWIYGQFPAISREVPVQQADGTVVVEEKPILVPGQVLKYSVGVGLKDAKGGKLDLYLNLVPFAWLVLFNLLQSRSLIGRPLTIERFRKDNKLGDVFPLQGSAVKVVTLGTEKHWLLVQLDTPFPYGGSPIGHLLVRDKEERIFKPGKAGRISYLVLVPDASLVQESGNRKDQFQFVDWGVVSVA